MLEKIQPLLTALKHRIMLMISRAVVRLADDDHGVQQMQVELLKNEVRTLPRLQNYGLSSHPHPGAEGVAVFLTGNRDSGVMLVVDDKRYRLKELQSGEVALYTDEGDVIHLMRNNHIKITTRQLTIEATDQIEMHTPLLKVSGDIQDENGTLDQLRQTYNSHTHIGDSGGVTSHPQQQV